MFLAREERARLLLHPVAHVGRALAQLRREQQHGHDRAEGERTEPQGLAIEEVRHETGAEQLERLGKRPDRLALQQRQREALEDQHAGQRHDERRDLEIRDEPALGPADDSPDDQAHQRGRDEVPFVLHHQDGGERADEARHRPDRQVDVPGHDHQQHAQRHDDDVAVLQDQVRQVQRLEQRAVGHVLEERHDRHERQQHAVLADVVLEEPAVGARLGSRHGGDQVLVHHRHAEAPCFTIARMIFSCVASADANSPTKRPSFIT